MLLAALCGALGAGPAYAVDVDVEIEALDDLGEICGGVIEGVVACDAASVVGGEVTVQLVLDATTSLNGYDFQLAWDPSELTLVSSSQLYPDGDPPDTLPFLIAPDPGDPTGSSAVVFSLIAFPTTALLSLEFDVAPSAVSDCQADVWWSANGAGLSPASVVLGNPDGAGLDFAAIRACNDGIDNDADGRIDFDGGACGGVEPASQTAPDNRCAGPTGNTEGKRCGLGFEIAAPLLVIAWLRRRRR